mmetsp:Transcript_9918/g.23253  ORF Transcript_9918/g.23253 Transcript_9918/m.23253 type:complete len:257 (+) Transcript_9918:629-1399(+)
MPITVPHGVQVALDAAGVEMDFQRLHRRRGQIDGTQEEAIGNLPQPQQACRQKDEQCCSHLRSLAQSSQKSSTVANVRPVVMRSATPGSVNSTIPRADGRLRHRVARRAEGGDDRLVGVEIDLPVVVGVAVGSHGQQRAFGRELQDLDVRRRAGHHVRDGGDGGLEAGDGVQRVHAVRDLGDAVHAAVRQRGVVLDGAAEDGVVADDGVDVVGAGDGGAEQADLGDRAGHAAGLDEVAHLERPQYLHEHASGEVGE